MRHRKQTCTAEGHRKQTRTAEGKTGDDDVQAPVRHTIAMTYDDEVS